MVQATERLSTPGAERQTKAVAPRFPSPYCLSPISRMTFSIRDLLALMLLIALGLLAWRTWDDARREKGRLAQVHNEIRSLKAHLRSDQPALHQAILHTRDELKSLDAMRAASLKHFEVLRKKYSTLAPQGDSVFSLRGLPSLATGAGLAPVLFRMWVPGKRPVWLKFGIHSAQQSLHTPDGEHANRKKFAP